MPAIPWYRSPVYVALLVSIVTQVLKWTGLSEQVAAAEVATTIDNVLQLVALTAAGYAAWKRQTSEIQPLTLRKGPEPEAPPAGGQGGFVRPALFGLLLALGAVSAATLPGCQSAGLEAPQSIDQRLAYAYGTHTAILDAAAAGVEQGRLSAEDGERVLDLADESRLTLDAARVALTAGDVSTAEGRLVLALGVLTQLQTYLNARGVK